MKSPVAVDYILQPLIGHNDLDEIKRKITALLCRSIVVLAT